MCLRYLFNTAGQTVCGLPQGVTKVSICFNKLTPVQHIVGRNKQKKG